MSHQKDKCRNPACYVHHRVNEDLEWIVVTYVGRYVVLSGWNQYDAQFLMYQIDKPVMHHVIDVLSDTGILADACIEEPRVDDKFVRDFFVGSEERMRDTHEMIVSGISDGMFIPGPNDKTMNVRIKEQIEFYRSIQ